MTVLGYLCGTQGGPNTWGGTTHSIFGPYHVFLEGQNLFQYAEKMTM